MHSVNLSCYGVQLKLLGNLFFLKKYGGALDQRERGGWESKREEGKKWRVKYIQYNAGCTV